MSQENDSTQMDDNSSDDSVFDRIADDFFEEAGFPDADESTEDTDEDTEELEGDDQSADEDAAEVDEDDDDETTEESDDEDDEDLPEDEDDEVEDEEDGEIDMSFMVPVKVDGTESEVSLEELVKGYQTDQNQTKRGQQLAEQVKEFKAKEEQVEAAMVMSYSMLQEQDEGDLNILKGMKAAMDKAVEEDDSYELPKLQHKYNSAKEEYTRRKADRDGKIEGMRAQLNTDRNAQYQESVTTFNDGIVDVIPDWTEDIRQANIDFAVSRGVSPEVLSSSIALDINLVKVLDDYRRSQETKSKGAVKRKKAPIKRTPSKKPASKSTKKKTDLAKGRNRINKGRGTEADHADAFDSMMDDIQF